MIPELFLGKHKKNFVIATFGLRRQNILKFIGNMIHVVSRPIPFKHTFFFLSFLFLFFFGEGGDLSTERLYSVFPILEFTIC